MLSCLIVYIQGREIATVDFPGEFIQADMDDEMVHLRLYGKMAVLLIRISQGTYQP